uniref:hypothetical protein n=1 Tax=unclassified Rhodococcus (in: high G+C Gram-positive bacteria) TaxID=192944 RepID=UPI00114034D0|nr:MULTISPECIES: hypothetical protein [unclassified Rhodococcus (in: high G+C Gram-positive bacteria)]
METWTLILTAATLAVTTITVVFVVVAEIRDRRRYYRVDFEVDHVGQVNDGAYELFELTNCGTETATRISTFVTGGLPGTAHDLRPIVVLAPGQSKRFVLDMKDALEDSWALFSYHSVSDRRYAHYVWQPLINHGTMADTWLANRDRTAWQRFGDWLRYRFRVVETVGPGQATGSSVRTARGEKTLAGHKTATEAALKWLSEKVALKSNQSGRSAFAD